MVDCRSLIDTISGLQETMAVNSASKLNTPISSTPQVQVQAASDEGHLRPRSASQVGAHHSPLDSGSLRDMWSSISKVTTPQPLHLQASEDASSPSPTTESSVTSSNSELPPSSTSRATTPTPQETAAIGFLPIDAKTKKPLIDPVLCADGSIRDRFEVIEQAEAALLKRGASVGSAFPVLKDKDRKRERALQIVGDIITFRLAIWGQFPERKADCFAKRQAFKTHALNLCGPEGHSQPARAIFALSHVLAYEPEETSSPLLVRRALLQYRIRNLLAAEHDLDRAIEISARGSKRNIDPDARRYRAWIRYACNDNEGAWKDVQEILCRVRDPLAFALRASMSASEGDVEAATITIEHIDDALVSFEDWASDVARQNTDLIYIAKGWALMSVRSRACILPSSLTCEFIAD